MGVVREQLCVRVLLTCCPCVQVSWRGAATGRSVCPSFQGNPGWSLCLLLLCQGGPGGELRWRHFWRLRSCSRLLFGLCRAYWVRRSFEPVWLALFFWYSRLRAVRRSYPVVAEGSRVLSCVRPVVFA